MVDKSTEKRLATEIVSKLTERGFVAFFAGGCVRDELLGLTPKDYDVATNALPNEVRRIFGRKRTIAVGQSFGVIAVLGPRPRQVEVATFRSDGEYSDGRHPDNVTFSSPEEDAQRRDFTINGMFFDPYKNEVIDYVGGVDDLKKGCIRAIGRPHDRIEEDHLRMLRAVRFAATYGFEIEPDTMMAVQDNHEKITSVSQERISHELMRMLLHRHRRRALELLDKAGLLKPILPELHIVKSDTARWNRLLKLANQLPNPTMSLVLATLLGKDGAGVSVNSATKICRRLKLANEIRTSVEWLLQHRADLEKAHEILFSRLQPLLIHAQIEQALQLLKVVAEVDQSATQHIDHCEEKLGLPKQYLDPPALIGGNDLIQSGIKPGPAFAKILRSVRTGQLDGAILDRQAALEFVQRQASQAERR